MVRPDLARAAAPIALDDNLHESRGDPGIVAMLNDVLQAQPVSLVLQLTLMAVNNGNHPELRKKYGQVADEVGSRDGRNEQSDALWPRLVDFPPVMYL